MKLTSDPIPGLLRGIAVPAATGMFLQTILNLTDAWFAGRVSTTGQAALALAFPMFFVLNTFGSGLSTGTGALVGRALGAGDPAAARRMAGQGAALALALGVMLTVLGPLISRPVFASLGASGDYLEMCVDYMRMIFYCSAPFLLLNAANAGLTAQGDSRSMRNALVAAAFLNAALDAWFLYGGLGLPALGIPGLALATSMVNLGGAVWLWVKLFRSPLFRDDGRISLKPDWALQKELWTQAVPSALNTASVGLGIYVINWFISHFGPGAVAAYGMAVRLEQLALLPAMGLAMAVLPLTAQNDGAGLSERVLDVRRRAAVSGAWLSAVALLVLFPGGRLLMSLVSPDPEVQRIGALYLKFDAAVFFAYTLLAINVAFLQGLKKPFFALWMGLYRQIAAPIVVYWLLAFTFGWELPGLWLGIVLVTTSGAVISEFYVRRVIRKKEKSHASGN